MKIYKFFTSCTTFAFIADSLEEATEMLIENDDDFYIVRGDILYEMGSEVESVSFEESNIEKGHLFTYDIH